MRRAPAVAVPSDELDEVLGGRPPTVADLPRLTQTQHIVDETLRLYPPGWMLGREATEPLELGGYRVAKGTTVFMTAYAIHRDPRWFDDPDAFRPERWADGLLHRIPRYAYFPFGAGPRIVPPPPSLPLLSSRWWLSFPTGSS